MSAASVSRLSGSPEETFELGRRLGEVLPSGSVLALVGELGAGKTLFTKGLACGLGVREHQRVTSPTFVIQQQYRGRLPIFHFDAYRLRGEGELAALGFLECLERGGGVVVVEWADRVSRLLPPQALTVRFEHGAPAPLAGGAGKAGGEGGAAPGCSRRLGFSGPGAPWSSLLAAAGLA
jgi:tRNA threonylcarbamoyladenosine biosynthesis protein TsaE